MRSLLTHVVMVMADMDVDTSIIRTVFTRAMANYLVEKDAENGHAVRYADAIRAAREGMRDAKCDHMRDDSVKAQTEDAIPGNAPVIAYTQSVRRVK